MSLNIKQDKHIDFKSRGQKRHKIYNGLATYV